MKILAEWSFFTELAIQTVCLVLLQFAAELFKELEDRLQIVNDDIHVLRKWKRQHDLVCTFVEQINEVFGLILLVIFSHIFTDMAYYAHEFMIATKCPSALLFVFGYSISLILDRSLLYFSQVFSA